MTIPSSLAELSVGDKATVGSLDNCPKHYKRLIAQMGILPGTSITVTRRAPLGDPIEISARGYRLTLRKHEAAEIPLTAITPRAGT